MGNILPWVKGELISLYGTVGRMDLLLFLALIVVLAVVALVFAGVSSASHYEAVRVTSAVASALCGAACCLVVLMKVWQAVYPVWIHIAHLGLVL